MDLKDLMKLSNWTPFDKAASWMLPSTKASIKVLETTEPSQGGITYRRSSEEVLMLESRNSKKELNHDECNLRFNRQPEAERNQTPGAGSVWKRFGELETASTEFSDEHAKVIPLLNEVIEIIRIKLKGNPCFSVHDIINHNKTLYQSKMPRQLGLNSEGKKGETTLDLALYETKIHNMLLAAYSEKELIYQATSDPQTSYELQLVMQMTGKRIDDVAKNITYNFVRQLIDHQHGSYVLQQLVKLSEEVRHLAIGYCMTKFDELYDDAYASRCMQLLAVYSKQFRLFLFNWLNRNLERAVSSPPAVFLLTNCMGRSSSHEELENTKIIMLREKISGKMFSSRYFKRMLVSFLENSRLKTVDEFVVLNQLDKSIKLLLNDKFGALILDSIIKHGEVKVLNRLCLMLATDLHGLFRTKYFKLFFYKTAKYAKESNRVLHNLLMNSLRRATPQSVRRVLSKEDSKTFLIFLLLITIPSTHHNFFIFLSDAHLFLASSSVRHMPIRSFQLIL